MGLNFAAKNNELCEMLNRSKLLIIEDGIVEVDSEWKGTTYGLPFSRIYYILEGSASYRLWDEEYKDFVPGNIYFIPFASNFRFDGGEYMKKLYFHVNVLNQNGFDLFDGAREVVTIPSSVDELSKIAKAYQESTYESFMQVQQSIYSVLCTAMSKSKLAKKNISVYSSPVKLAMEYIKEHLTSNLTVSDVAKATFVSESFLKKHFSAEVGISIGKYIDEMIFFSARQLLAKKELSIQQIGQQLGFCDQFYFSRRFKQFFGETPSNFRKKYFSPYEW